MQLASIFRVAQEHQLLPLDLPERVVLKYNDLDGQLVFHARSEFTHQHGHATIANKRQDLTVGVGDLCSDRIGQSTTHGRHHAGHGMHLGWLRRNVASPPCGYRAGVNGHNRIIAKPRPELSRQPLGLHRHFPAGLGNVLRVAPHAHAGLDLLQETAVTAAL
jgi:hypothetical protein